MKNRVKRINLLPFNLLPRGTTAKISIRWTHYFSGRTLAHKRAHTLRTEIAFPLKERQRAVLIKSLKAYWESAFLAWYGALASGRGCLISPNCRKEDVYVGGAGKRLICWHATSPPLYLWAPFAQGVQRHTLRIGNLWATKYIHGLCIE